MNAQQPIVGVLLAAGAGTRFGGGKLVHPLEDGAPIAAHAARNLVAAGLDVIAVVRSGDFPLADILEQEGCEVTHCAESVHGMGHTLAHGVAEIREAGGWIVALADMPRVRPQTIQAVAAAIKGGAVIAAPFYRGERGHPVGFSARVRDELTQLRGDTGAKAVLARHADEIVRVDCDDPGVLLDIDLRTDLHRAR
ncbi:MAG TPA: nucleotidyltransferase family protein [Burkholderiales bacterium]|nr:nucleotidyltransferase family protein [Burkholderiales bacterium]